MKITKNDLKVIACIGIGTFFVSLALDISHGDLFQLCAGILLIARGVKLDD